MTGSTLGKQPAVAKELANKQGGEKKWLGVNQPEGTRAQSLKHREPVSQGRPSQVSSSVKYQQLIVYPFSFSLSLSCYPSISAFFSYDKGQQPQIGFWNVYLCVYMCCL